MPYETRCRTGRTSAKVRATKSRRNLSQRTHPILPIGPKTDVLVRFVLFGCIFATNAPDQPSWTLKLRFGAFQNIWVHSGPFGCLMKLGAKQAEPVQKFVPRSRVGIFRNKRTRSTPLDPKLTFGVFCTIWVHSETVWMPYETQYKAGRTSAKVRATKLRRNFSQRTHPIHPIGP